MPTLSPTEKYALEQEPTEFLQQLEDWLEMPMLVLTWLALLVIELIWGLTLLEVAGIAIWIIFILASAIHPQPTQALTYLKRNWQQLFPAATGVACFPDCPYFALAALCPCHAGLRLVRIVSSLNRHMRPERA